MGEQPGMQRQHIETRADIERVAETFYLRVMVDLVLGPNFTDVARLDLQRACR